KVDMKFMKTLETSPQTKIIVKSIIEMTKNLKLRTLMEGVETETQARFIKAIGADMSQGYLFSRPVPIDELKFDQKKIG
ncbi:MAG: EAL domain-containing protein, partial [Eubacterium sp.]|nr:EAL domain-containing protein [Eubacterium sp.]